MTEKDKINQFMVSVIQGSFEKYLIVLSQETRLILVNDHVMFPLKYLL